MRSLFTLLFLLWTVPAVAGVIEGRVVYRGEPVAGIAVKAYRTLDFLAEPVAVSAPTESDGAYRIELLDGRYALFASDPARKHGAETVCFLWPKSGRCWQGEGLGRAAGGDRDIARYEFL
jgi:hypothetical protein